MNTLNGKVALVTGASRGIGASIARKLAAQNASVVVNYQHNEDAAQKVVADIRQDGGRAVALRRDVADTQSHEQIVREVVRHFGAIDILVNNAGVFGSQSLDGSTIDEFDRLFATNVRGLFFLTQQTARVLRDGGRIVNISSVAAAGRFPNMSIYAATKAAVHALTSVWARELGGRGITVNSVSPGATNTDATHAAHTEETIQMLAGMSLFGRLGQPDDIGDAVAFLCSPEARWITAREIIADGGLLYNRLGQRYALFSESRIQTTEFHIAFEVR